MLTTSPLVDAWAYICVETANASEFGFGFAFLNPDPNSELIFVKTCQKYHFSRFQCNSNLYDGALSNTESLKMNMDLGLLP